MTMRQEIYIQISAPFAKDFYYEKNSQIYLKLSLLCMVFSIICFLSGLILYNIFFIIGGWTLIIMQLFFSYKQCIKEKQCIGEQQ